jgi:uncharacterized protein DUF2442
MILHVCEVRYVRDFVVWLRFNDGAEGEVDLQDELHGEVFEPLRDVTEFRKLRLDPELDTIAWDNGADFAPEFLHEQLSILARAP